ncbi:MAG: ATP-grasp domain-containing protein [Nannocystaceae bacterium]
MQILVTSSRMPYAVSEIRAFGRMGHTVHTADTFDWAPGNHSAHAAVHHETVSPREDPEGYIAQLNMIADMYRIDLIVPTFEEVLYLAQRGLRAGGHQAQIFAPSFELLALLHDKGRFTALAADLGLKVAPPRLCRSRDEFVAAIAEHDRYFARAVLSRAGSGICTNTGPLAASSRPDAVTPTEATPWIVQPFLEGEEICSFSIVRGGHVVAHSTYRHPKALDGCGGIVFESLDEPRTLEAAQRIAAHLGYHGQLSFDFMAADDGELYLIECNPRPTAGVTVMPPEIFVPAVLGEYDGQATRVAPAGTRRSIRSALLRDIVMNPREWRSAIEELFSDAEGVYYESDDPLPGLYQFLSLAHVLEYRRKNEDATGKLSTDFLHDICWDGTILPPAARPLDPAAPPAARAALG